MPNALIWGASGGMGQALVTHLKTHSWHVYAAARHSEHIPQQADLALEFSANDEASFQAVTMSVAQQATQVDLMVYAVGDLTYDKLDSMGQAGLLATLQSNLIGAYLASVACLPLMTPQTGEMVFIGAYLDHIRLPKMGAYAIAKAGLDELVQVLRKENRKQRFTIVRPGPVQTGFWANVSFKMPADAKAPSVIAEAILTHHQNQTLGDINL